MVKMFLIGYITCSFFTFLIGVITNDELMGMRFCCGWFLLPLEFIFKGINNNKRLLKYLHNNYTVYNLFENEIYSEGHLIIKNTRIKEWSGYFTDKTWLELSKNQKFDVCTFLKNHDGNRKINKMLRKAFGI